jgi:hypothetical protein
VDIVQVFPNESPDERVSRGGLIPAIGHFVACCRPFDATVIHEGLSDVGDLGFENEGNIFVEYCTGVSPTLWQAGRSHRTDGGLDCGEVA